MKIKMIPFADRINEYLKATDRNQVDVSRILGNITPQGISKWCTGKSMPKLDEIPEIAEKLGVSVFWLFGFPNMPRTNDNREMDELMKAKFEDQKIMDEAPQLDINGSLYPVYTKEQLDKRMDMLQQAMNMFTAGKITQDMLELIVRSLR